MTERWLYVTWTDGTSEDRRPVRAITSRWPAVLGKTGMTLRRTIRVRPARYVAFQDLWAWGPFWRHELAHVLQQPEGRLAWTWWLVRYVVWPPFRRRIEREAQAAEQVTAQLAGGDPYPRFRMVSAPEF